MRGHVGVRMFASLCVCLQVCVCVCECVCARTSCASLPVLLSHGEDLLHPVVHRFSKPAELVALLLPAQTHTHTHTFVRPPSSTPPPGPLLTGGEPRAPADGVGAQPTHTSMGSRSGASGSMVAKIITPTVSSFSAFLFPVFQSYNTINTVSTSGGVFTRHGRTDTRPKDPTRKRHRQARPSAARW